MVSENQKLEKGITFLIKVMNGGGAERVTSIISNAMVSRGADVTLILTHQKREDAVLRDIDERIRVISLEDSIADYPVKKSRADALMLYGRMISKASRVLRKKESETGLICRYYARDYRKVSWLREYFRQHSKNTVIAFLYDSIFLALGAVTKTNHVIISERGDPEQSKDSRTTMAFLHRRFPKADGIVFQSPDVQKWYREHMGVEGRVIFNPIRAGLPERYRGERQKKIVNFCRISRQKNLELLFEAFELFCKDHEDYELHIYGDPVGDLTDGYPELLEKRIAEKSLQDKIHIYGSRKDVHTAVADYAMFVSSSDFEGMSNSMLEAMAIGLPCICTDCPAGGARAVIEDHHNGILVPVKDAERLYRAMKEVAENPELAEKLSENGSAIKDELTEEKIIEKWLEIIND